MLQRGTTPGELEGCEIEPSVQLHQAENADADCGDNSHPRTVFHNVGLGVVDPPYEKELGLRLEPRLDITKISISDTLKKSFTEYKTFKRPPVS